MAFPEVLQRPERIHVCTFTFLHAYARYCSTNGISRGVAKTGAHSRLYIHVLHACMVSSCIVVLPAVERLKPRAAAPHRPQPAMTTPVPTTPLPPAQPQGAQAGTPDPPVWMVLWSVDMWAELPRDLQITLEASFQAARMYTAAHQITAGSNFSEVYAAWNYPGAAGSAPTAHMYTFNIPAMLMVSSRSHTVRMMRRMTIANRSTLDR
jgi:hypothetical protein